MGVIDTNDAGRRHLIQVHQKVLAMFTAEHCATCEQLRPVFELFATNQAYAGIAFLRLPAAEIPLAQQVTTQFASPFFISYCQGRVVHFDTLATEQQVRAMLNALLTHL